jgi:hypothetical protein
MTPTEKPFKEKYFDEAFLPWYATGMQDGISAIMTPDGWYGNMNDGEAEYLVKEHERLRRALWEAVKYDYELFTKLRDL